MGEGEGGYHRSGDTNDKIFFHERKGALTRVSCLSLAQQGKGHRQDIPCYFIRQFFPCVM